MCNAFLSGAPCKAYLLNFIVTQRLSISTCSKAKRELWILFLFIFINKSYIGTTYFLAANCMALLRHSYCASKPGVWPLNSSDGRDSQKLIMSESYPVSCRKQIVKGSYTVHASVGIMCLHPCLVYLLGFVSQVRKRVLFLEIFRERSQCSYFKMYLRCIYTWRLFHWHSRENSSVSFPSPLKELSLRHLLAPLVLLMNWFTISWFACRACDSSQWSVNTS